MKTILVGDIHGDFNFLRSLIAETEETIIQLGDLGIGFPIYSNGRKLNTLTNFKSDKDKFNFIRGNHDNPEVCRANENYLGDYGIFNDMFFVSGAWSIDRQFRTTGLDWWEEEELSMSQLNQMLDIYEHNKPDIVLTHDCPSSIANYMYSHVYPTRTGQAFEQMLSTHVPKFWYFAHHHKKFEIVKEDCLFKCLDCNEKLMIG